MHAHCLSRTLLDYYSKREGLIQGNQSKESVHSQESKSCFTLRDFEMDASIEHDTLC
jgi:hypothetical protein